MRRDLLTILVCPACKSELELSTLDDGGTSSHTGVARIESEVTMGVLRCGCGAAYPLIDGVPRLLEGGLASFPAFVDQYRTQIRTLLGDRAVAGISSSEVHDGDDYANIRESFSKEWSIFDYNRDKTWGWSLAERRKVFLDDVQLQAHDLIGKRLLDAGCGNGTLSAALTDFGLNVVGLDLSDGLGLAYLNRCMYGNAAKEGVQYVQGNLVQPPFKEGSYDIVYSSGVIHHTPSSRDSFRSLSRMVKGGGRLYVWVYGKRGWPVRLFFAAGRSLSRFLSFHSLMRVCRLLAPMYKAGADTLDGLNLVPFRRRTVREITLDLFDVFAPRYNHWHTEGEVHSWFKEQGFQNINVAGVQKHGFGMYGDKS